MSLLGVALATFVACSDDGSPASSPSGDDGGTVLPPGDGSIATDAEDIVDAAADVAVDAGRRICSDDGFCHSVVPKGQNLHGVWGDGQGVVWAVSLQGDILRWDGASWKVHHHSDVGLVAIWGSGPADLWVVTAAGLLHGSGATSASIAFSPVPDLPGASSVPLASIWGTGPNDIWVAGGVADGSKPVAGRVLHYGSDGDGGARWIVDDVSAQAIGFRAVWGTPASGVWLHGIERSTGLTRARVLRRASGAATWTTVDVPEDPGGGAHPFAREIFAAAPTSDTTVWLRGKTGASREALWRGTSIDNGATFAWTFINPGAYDRVINAFWGGGPNTWAVGEWGLVARRDGTDWKQAAIRVTGNPVGKTFRAIWGTDNDDFWVVGDEVALHKTSAGKP